MDLCGSGQVQDFWLERGINGQPILVGMTFLAVPGTKGASRLSEDRREGRHVPDLDRGVEHDFGTAGRDRVIAVGITPAASEETVLVQPFERVQPSCGAKSRPTRV